MIIMNPIQTIYIQHKQQLIAVPVDDVIPATASVAFVYQGGKLNDLLCVLFHP